ncbi:FlgB family protein [Puniceibacterium sediminis]|uniref:Flagellar basal-body rod protein FlgB n=1 Tax=Puniceibacterium sediminis TaxID=1608407 RepID=A0A238WUI8_9RHOB|nr:FlgB family protein [Puniceibacterium sediminis]SNR49874.1 flagellar basal-body rod protein FlgB [Puniceibacterium sediminis]
MFQNLEIFKTAMAMARHAGTQQGVTAQNIANADTPGYRGHDVMGFAQMMDRHSGPDQLRATRAAHLMGQTATEIPTTERRESADPNGNTVSIETEMLTAVEARREHDTSLAIYRSNLNILRTSLGRG